MTRKARGGFVALVCFSLLLGCSRVGEARDSRSREAAFQEVFGFPVPGDVTGVLSSWWRLDDSYVRWIRVGCGAPTMDAVRRLKRVQPSHFVMLTMKPGTPMGPRRRNVFQWWIDNLDATPGWWLGAAGLPLNPEHFTLGSQTGAKQDLVVVWIDAGTGVVYAARMVCE